MNRDTVLTRLCDMASTVGTQVFRHNRPHDCFCHKQQSYSGFQFDEEVMVFIEKAVEKAIAEHVLSPMERLVVDTSGWDIYRGATDVQHFVSDLLSRVKAAHL